MPVTSGGASRLTSPSSDDVSGATTPTTPVGSGIVKLKYGAATGFDEPRTWAILSAQPAYQTQRSIARSTTLARRAASRSPSAAATSATNWSRRPSISSATRYRTWPRFIAVLRGPARERLARGADRVAQVLARGPAGVGERRRRRRPTTRYERPALASAGTPRRCTACRSCGPRSAAGGRGGRPAVAARATCRCAATRLAARGHQRSSSRT